MEKIPENKFTSPEEEIAFLRGELAAREKALLNRNKEVDTTDIETLGKEALVEYGEHDRDILLTKKQKMPNEEIAASLESLKLGTSDKEEEVFTLAQEKGIRNALTVLERMGDAHLTDEVHRKIIAFLRAGKKVAGLDEGMPAWKAFQMTLFEVALPEEREESNEMTLSMLMSGMEQFYAGMQSVGGKKLPDHYTLEIGVSDKRDDIIFYVAVPTDFINLFEKQILSLFPTAVLTEQNNDYNIFVEGGESAISLAKLKKHPIYPLRLHDTFENDPLNVLLNTLSKIEREGGGAAIQLLIKTGGEQYRERYEGIIKKIRKGEETDVAIRKSTLSGEMYESVKDIFITKKKEDESPYSPPDVDTTVLELFESKTASQIVTANIRLATSAKTKERAEQILSEIEAGFNQFENAGGNTLEFKRVVGAEQKRELKAFSFREYSKAHLLPLSFTELSTIIHFPEEGVDSSPQFKQSRAKTAPAPNDMPQHGTLLGVNGYRNVDTDIYLTPEDRLRHFYIIGQTGTGKTTLMKNVITQDIENGAGVCMIDPHGTDIEDVLASVPDSRKDDVIYFDPARTDRVMGLNMLEYEETHPEQKTFVINELFSIFQKLYGGNPESMGPMFEQYFRNSTALVLEDPESGSTLLDVSRVMVDATFRREKLAKSRNPVVTQFWTEIATKAGGEAALENIVPYITSKFDIFTANDYMRPIIGQQSSSFNFRDIMDNKKILLVNLSKGRIGEINANLIGMIVVGKVLMAALSRVDSPNKQLPPFYLHIDEFQNVTTDSIAAILSEARKYRLGLTIAHQYIAQIDENIREAVFGNVGSLAAFRVGPEDAEFLTQQFEPTFEANDLMNIENRNAYVRLLAEGTPTKPFSMRTNAPKEQSPERIQELIQYSYAKYGKPRRKVEMEISARYQTK